MSFTTMAMVTKLGRVVTYHELLTIKSHDPTTVRMATILGRLVTDLKGSY